MMSILRDGRARGEFVLRLPTALSAYLLVDHLRGAVAWWLSDQDGDFRDFIGRALAQYLAGVAAPAETSVTAPPAGSQS